MKKFPTAPTSPDDPVPHVDVLQNLEAITVILWREYPELTDYAVERAYDAAFQRYRAEARGRRFEEPKLNGPEAELLENLLRTCEWRLGRASLGPEADAKEADETEGADRDEEEAPTCKPIPVEDLVDCLRRLLKSVRRHTKRGGRQGYLQFVGQFMPVRETPDE